MAITTTQEKFLHELGDIYDAENRFLKAQQAMLKSATDATLREGIEQHIAESEQQVANLEQVFELLGEKAKGEPCDAAKGIVTEGQKNLKEAGTDEIRDCLIGSSLTKVEHYEIVSYTGLIVGAEAMGNKEAVTLLQQNLRQEEQTAQKLEKNAPKLLKQAMQAEAQ
jgi:ferritin-like metal-binding protein YciE